MGNVICRKDEYDVTLLSVEPEVAESINKEHVNPKYFPNIPLHPSLNCTLDKDILKDADIIFFGIPSNIVVSYAVKTMNFLIRKRLSLTWLKVLVPTTKQFHRDWVKLSKTLSTA
jgi:glycerol-3-phosphate dehydrogenase